MKVIRERLIFVVKERDFLAKGVCLLLAVILWAFIISGKTENLRYRVPVVTRNLPANLAVVGLSGRFAVVMLEGKKDELKSVNIKSIRATVNMAKAVVGEEKAYPIQVEKLEVPEDVVISLVDSEITLLVEKKEDKWIKVLPNITGSVPKGKIVIDRLVIPERVKISGPVSTIGEIESIETEAVSIENETGDLQRQVGLDRNKYKDVTFGEKNFTVKVLITDIRDLAMITVPVGVRNVDNEYAYELKDREVEVYVRMKNNRPVDPGEVEAFVDAGKLNAKAFFEYEQKDTLVKDLPVMVAGISVNTTDIISVIPKKVLVRITHKKKQ